MFFSEIEKMMTSFLVSLSRSWPRTLPILVSEPNSIPVSQSWKNFAVSLLVSEESVLAKASQIPLDVKKLTKLQLLYFFFFFLHCPLFHEGCGAVAQDSAATPHGLPSPPSFCLGEVPSDSIQDPQCNRSI